MFGFSALALVPPDRLPFVYGAIIVLLFVSMVVIHWSRRASRQPVKPEPPPSEPTEGMVQAFDLVERLYHWSLFVVAGLMVLTGLAIFVPGTLDFLLESFGITSAAGILVIHTDMVWALLGLLVIHIVWDLAAARGWRNIWFGKKDISDTMLRTRNFFGMTKRYPKPGKYDIFMKTLHWGMAVSLVILGVTGIFLWNPYGLFPSISPTIDSYFRILHDLFAFLFVGLVIGHVYFAVIPVNWPVLRAIFTGNMSREAYLKEHDSERWVLRKRQKAVKEKAKAAKPQAPIPVTRSAEADPPSLVDPPTGKLSKGDLNNGSQN